MTRIERLVEIVKKCEWASAPHRDEGLCPCCGGRQPLAGDVVGENGFGHADDCEIASALSAESIAKEANPDETE